MTEHKTMNTIIHAAFRRDLRRFEQALAQFPDGAYPRAAHIYTAWDNFSQQLHRHHEDEETLFWPALQQLGWNDTTGAELHDEHADMQRHLGRPTSPWRRCGPSKP